MTLLNIIQLYRARSYQNEDAFQIGTAVLLDKLAHMNRLAWFHPSPNVYRRAVHGLSAIRLGSKGKKMGVKAGVPDCIIHSHKIAIELKVKRGTVSDSQRGWINTAGPWGWKCYICRTPDQVLYALTMGEVNVLSGPWLIEVKAEDIILRKKRGE